MSGFWGQGIITHAQNQISSTHDCTDIRVSYEDDPTLTQEEKIALMDQAFFDSLNQYDACQSASSAMAGGSSNSGGGNGGANEGGAGTNGQMNGGGKSVASSAMSGTEAPKPISSAQDISEYEDEENSSELNEETGGSVSQAEQGAVGGAVPSDIPSADNDDALASQIRYAATQETDPVKKAQLWNEYRKYKGLPAK